MKQNRTPLIIIGAVIVIAIVGLVVYALNRQANDQYMNDMNHGHSESNQGATKTDAEATDAVTIQNYAFSPKAITVKVGTKVTWTNQDGVEHTVTTQDGAPAKIDSGLFGKGKSFSFTFDKAGAYEYYCEPHPYMKGTVIVTE